MMVLVVLAQMDSDIVNIVYVLVDIVYIMTTTIVATLYVMLLSQIGHNQLMMVVLELLHRSSQTS